MLKMTNATDAVNTALKGMEGRFGDTFGKIQANGANFVQVVSGAMNQLKGNVATSSGAAKTAAEAAFQGLHDEAIGYFTSLEQQVSLKIGQTGSAITKGSSSAAAAAAGSYAGFAQSVQQAMQSGVISTSSGASLIQKELNDALKAFGSKPVQGITSITGASVAAGAVGFANKVLGSLTGAATGARVPGAVGPDSWTLVSPSGMPAAKVGGGELLIANRHTEAAASMATQAMYGQTLGQMVAGETRTHTSPPRARGGQIPRFATGGTTPTRS